MSILITQLRERANADEHIKQSAQQYFKEEIRPMASKLAL